MINKTSEELIAEFPFLKATDDNPWCYGNCGGDNWFYECPEGWQELFYNVLVQIKDLLGEGTLQVHQIKEKFGQLRFYYELLNVPEENIERIRNLTEYLERKSEDICIHCGKPAKWYTTGWITYICDECKDRINIKCKSIYNNENNN